MSNILREMADHLPVIQQTYPEDTCLILCDKEKIIGYLPGEVIDLKLKIGESMTKYKKSATYKVLQTGKKIREEIPEEVLGVPYISTCTPIKESGQMVGALAAAISNHKLAAFRKGAEELSSVIGQLTFFSEEMAATTDSSADKLQELSQQSETMKNNMKNVEKIIQQVKEIASRSNILGLNAAIEAARSGEFGRGFSVVADEIRKMAANSNSAAEDIQKQLELTQLEILKVNESIHEIAAQTEEQSASTQEFHSMLQRISETAALLNKHGGGDQTNH
ncbi:chemotaxis protein [Bacillus aerolatus]|uniref:Chemotaxis protein n=1 Tax=Bacillus aerolatus TaxID=2653354 RepID=A0A6I1FDJ3_9BACI|nr:methyl-accepting chemotaxis protein [Bacillus aerolatus]KAB7705550.1 chemotaxis protein [Bacillus aerolatus]